MPNAKRSVVLAACLILVCAASALAQDWPQWRGPARDGKVAGFTAPKAWPKELTKKWSVPVGAGDATPALVGEKVYVFTRQGADEVTLCLNAADGKEVWKDKYAAQAVTGAARRHPGPRSSPAVADGKVVTCGVGGVLSCLDAKKGTVVWRKDPFPKVVPRFFAAMSPIIADGMVIAHLGGSDKAAVIAYALADGKEKWRWAGDGPAYASPVLMTAGGAKQIVVQTEKHVVGLSLADGKRLWQVATPAGRRFYNSATPIVSGDTLIYTGQGQGTKAVKIEKKGDAFAAKDLWTNADLGTGFNTPVLKNGLLFGLSNRGRLFCINAKDGKAAWTDTAAHGRGFGAVLDAGDAILALPSTGELIAFKPTADKYDQLANIKVAEKATYAHPVVAGEKIFVKDQDSLTCWTMK